MSDSTNLQGRRGQIIRNNDNSNLQDIPLWLDGHNAFHHAGLSTSSARTSDDALVKIITPSAFAGGLIRVRPSLECQSDLQQKHTAAAVPYGLNSGVDVGKWSSPPFLPSVSSCFG